MPGNIVGTAVREQGVIQDGLMFNQIYPLHIIMFYHFLMFYDTSYFHSCCICDLKIRYQVPLFPLTPRMDVRLPCSYISDCKKQKCTNLVSNGKTFIRSFVTSDELVQTFQGRYSQYGNRTNPQFFLKNKNSLNGKTSCPVQLLKQTS